MILEVFIQMAVNNDTPKIPITFEDFCKFYGIRHYADKRTYDSINSIWNIIHKKMQKDQFLFTNYELFMNYLHNVHDTIESKYKFSYWYIINEFTKYKINIELYFQNFKNYNKRLIGYSKNNKCRNIRELKLSLTARIKRLKIDGTDFEMEQKYDFLIMVRYICDYLQDFPDDIPQELFKRLNILKLTS